MKYILNLLLIFLSFSCLKGEENTSIKMDEYELEAIKQFKLLFEEEKDKQQPRFAERVLYHKYRIEELQTLTIPIFEFKNEYYKCGKNIDSMLLFINDALFQHVLVINNKNKVVGEFSILNSFYQRQKEIDKDQVSIYGAIFFPDTEQVEKKIAKFIKDNPDKLVFLIKELDGYWFIEEGKIKKIINSSFGLKGFDGSSYLKNYGEDYINDVISGNGLKAGRLYKNCY